ncbi:AraC family transcriptional regulator [Phaeovulum sp. W22_SRMD_FR3]|uniref:AraC family transcriptional regulator n=1 Tax=Phaeovulum sp. W22_SRMD_FR3 TaxID=3240274 RepID=UPI003F95545F
MTQRPAPRESGSDPAPPRARLPLALARALMQLEGESTLPDLPRTALRGLGQAVGLSATHLQRQFHRRLGLSPSRYAQLVRMRRAGLQLAFRPGLSVLTIALEAGYATPEAFARAFRRLSGQSPRQFRSRPAWARWQAACAPLTQIRSLHMPAPDPLPKIEIRDVPAIPVIVLEHRGPVAGLGDTLRRFINWRRAEGLGPAHHATYNIFHTPPGVTPPEAFRLDLCLAHPPARLSAQYCAGQADMRRDTIPAGRVAVLRVIGDDAAIGPGFERLFRDWLPGSGSRPRAHPPYARRLRFYPDVPASAALTELFLPLE